MLLFIEIALGGKNSCMERFNNLWLIYVFYIVFFCIFFRDVFILNYIYEHILSYILSESN